MTDVLDSARMALDVERGIGSTDTPKILSLSRHGTALSVWDEKMGRARDEDEMSLPAWLGLRLQGAVAEMFTQATGTGVRADKRIHWHPRIPYVYCHLDYRELGRGGSRRIVECKTRAHMRGWGPVGSTEIPPDIFAQVQHQMAVIDGEWTEVAVLFGHHTFRHYRIPRHDGFIEALENEEWPRFWQHVLDGTPPPITGQDQDNAWLRRHFPHNDGTIRSATAEQERRIKRLLIARQNRNAVQSAFQALENEVRLMIGEHDGITGDFGTITLKRTKDRTTVDWQRVADHRGKMVDALLEMAAPGEDERLVTLLAHVQHLHPILPGLYSKTEDGSRRINYDTEDD